jgi:hypothetical protein
MDTFGYDRRGGAMIVKRCALFGALAIAGCHLVFPYASSDARRDGARRDHLPPDSPRGPDTPQGIPFETIAQGQPTTVGDPSYAAAHKLVITDQTTLDKYLQAVQASGSVSFAAQLAVADGLGPQGTDAVSAEIETIVPTGTSVQVRYVGRSACAGATVVTHPFHLVKLARQAAPFAFQMRTEGCCDILAAEARARLAEIATCGGDGDCVVALGEGCPFYDCFFYKNKNSDDTALREAVLAYKSQAECFRCQASCSPPPIPSLPGCKNGVCGPR